MKRIVCLAFVLIVVECLGLPFVVWGEEKPSVQSIQLRSEPLTVSSDEMYEVFDLTTRTLDWGTTEKAPRIYVDNDYEAQGDVIVDHTTGLMWQQSGSAVNMSFADAQQYIEQLNQEQFAGYADWRLPTIPELMSLLEPIQKNGELYIDPLFDATQRRCWSADLFPTLASMPSVAWIVKFRDGHTTSTLKLDCYVRAVRSIQSVQEQKIVGEESMTLSDLNKGLGRAVGENDVEKVKALLASGAEVDSRAFDGTHTPLMMAAFGGDSEVMKVLIEAGADVNAVHSPNHTVLYHALESKKLRAEMIKLLIDAEVDVNTMPLALAVELLSSLREKSEAAKILGMLIDAGSDVNAQDQSGFTPLVYAACRGGSNHLMDILLRSGAEIDTTVGEAGITALICAVKMEHIETVGLLVKAGADIELADKSGNTPLMIAKSNGYEEIVKLLTDAGATR